MHPGKIDRAVGDWPLTWWAVNGVSEYSGRINLWLAGGFGKIARPVFRGGLHRSLWLGQRVFQCVTRSPESRELTTGLVVLAAVPAAFQYGLWDSTAEDPCLRLELLLLTRLEARDYWEGGGRRGVAVRLWLSRRGPAPVDGGRDCRPCARLRRSSSPASAVFCGRCISRWGFCLLGGMQANGFGLVLTVGLPLAAYVLHAWVGRSSVRWLAWSGVQRSSAGRLAGLAPQSRPAGRTHAGGGPAFLTLR